MVKTITNAMLREALNMAANNTTGTMNTQGSVSNSQATDVPHGITIMEKTITKVKGSKMICKDGTKAELYSPMPCLFWKCLARCDDKGVAVLAKPIKGLFLTLGDTSYCLGVSGASDEFEVRFHVGKNEVRLNNDFLNLSGEHVVIQGLEYDNEVENV